MASRNTHVSDSVHTKSDGAVQESKELPVTVTTMTVDGIVEVTVSTSLKVNLGNYETKDSFGSAKGRFPENTDPGVAGEFLLDFIYGALNDELTLAKDLAPKTSAVHRIATN